MEGESTLFLTILNQASVRFTFSTIYCIFKNLIASMKPNPIPLIAALFLLTFSSSAQEETKYQLLLKSGSFIPTKNISVPALDLLSHRLFRTEEKSFVIIQFENIPTDAERQLLINSGIELLDYIPHFAYTATIAGALKADIFQNVKARAIVDLSPQQKMDENLAYGIFPAWAVKIPGTVDVWISYPRSFSFETVSNELLQRNVEILSTVFKNYRVIALRIAAQRLAELASLPFVEYVQTAPHEDQPLLHNSEPNARANVLQSALPGGRNLKGEGVTIGVGDNGNPLQHIDFAGRLINRAATAGAAHGVHVTGIAGGAGIVLERFHGYAPKSTIIGQVFSGIYTNAPAYVQDHGMVITNNSYGNVVDDCNYHGLYDLYSRILDQQAFDLPYLQQVFAVGNSGTMNCSPYPAGFRTALGSFQAAKNVIDVGYTDELGVIRPSSSKGPVRDGRIKPEVTAQGGSVYSTFPTNNYGFNSGSSMAAPAVSGGLALLYQRYRQLHSGANPKNALMKTLLCNGATDIGNNGPDFTYGFGWMNLLRSVQMLEANNYVNDSLANGNSKTHSITVPANTAQLKVMLYWNDPAASVFASKTLVNDLDLKVIGLASDTTLPKMLDTIPANVNNVATTGADHLNNIEQVVITNPALGNYTALVKGTVIAQNPRQEYFLVYDIIPVSTTLTFPVGGERFMPGDSIYISWDAWGNPANTFTVSYSLDNGATWTDTTVAADQRQMKWFVPGIATNQAKVKIVRNGTAMTSISETFTILDVPVLSLASTQCEGYIALNWTAVAGATDYEVMLLQGDDMVPVAVTNATNYTLNGLSKDSVYWVAVRARLNGKPGRRSQAVSRQPNNGTCAGTISDNDLKMDALISPVSGRKFTSTELSSSQVISVRIKNLDDAAVNSFQLSYSVNSGAWITESVNTTVAGGATFAYNFSAPYNFSATGNYLLKVAVTNTSASDPVTANDTLSVVIKQLDNPVIDLTAPFLDNMDAAPAFSATGNQTGLSGLDRYDFVTNTTIGRIRSFINTGIAYSGNRALTLDADRYNGAGTADSLKGTFNLSAYTATVQDIRLEFRYKNHGQLSNPANKVWIRGDDTKPWIEIYDLYTNQNPVNGIYKLTPGLELSRALTSNGQNFSSSFQVRWGQWGQILAADNDGGAGYTFDDVRLYQVVNDMQMISIDTPMVSSCGLSNATPVKVTVRNSSFSTLTNIPVKYRIDGGSIITETIPALAANTTLPYAFTTTANLSVPGNHIIQAWVDYPSDSYRGNDTATVSVVNSVVIAGFPYLEDFENNNGGYYTAGANSSWAYGTPFSLKVVGAASGSHAWKTNLSGTYNSKELSYLYSPCFDISGLTNPTLSFSIALDIEDCGGSLCDGAYVEYSPDGKTWNRLGAFNQGTNWYNKNYSGNNLWSVRNYTRWHVATIPLPTGISRLRLRFVMTSDESVEWDGMAIDDIHIYDNSYPIYDGPTLTVPVTQTIGGGTNWTHFITGGKIIASVQPNGLNMGSTPVQAYINTTGIRNFNGQYYLDRNLTIKPSTRNFSDSAIVRFYFLDTESEALINAAGCSSCSKPASAYDAGISKYSDPDSTKENGTVTDDVNGNWSFIPAASVRKVPFDKGYYAEFKTRKFSEFWLNNGSLGGALPLQFDWISFTAKKQINNDVLLEWTVAHELNVDRYEIEVAKGNTAYQQNNFVKIGMIDSRGNSAQQQQYNFTDAENGKSGVRYYRLKVIGSDGSFQYSEVRPVIFNDEITWKIYPNPSTGIFYLLHQEENGTELNIKLYDANGRLVYLTKTMATGFVEKLVIDGSGYAAGIYLIRVESQKKIQFLKIIKQ
jgi:hypothetical protein